MHYTARPQCGWLNAAPHETNRRVRVASRASAIKPSLLATLQRRATWREESVDDPGRAAHRASRRTGQLEPAVLAQRFGRRDRGFGLLVFVAVRRDRKLSTGFSDRRSEHEQRRHFGRRQIDRSAPSQKRAMVGWTPVERDRLALHVPRGSER